MKNFRSQPGFIHFFNGFINAVLAERPMVMVVP